MKNPPSKAFASQSPPIHIVLLSAVNVKLLICDLYLHQQLSRVGAIFPLRYSHIITHKSFLHAKHIFSYFVPRGAFAENLINLIKILWRCCHHTHPNTHSHITPETPNTPGHALSQPLSEQMHKGLRISSSSSRRRHNGKH